MDISILRFFRVLRPLRALSHVPELQVAVDSLLASAPSLIYICLVYMCYLSFFAALMLMVGVGNLGQVLRGFSLQTCHLVSWGAAAASSGLNHPCEGAFSLVDGGGVPPTPVPWKNTRV